MDTEIQNRLGEWRKLRGMAAAELAQRVGVSRQTVYAIESGTYVPNTEVALRLARALEVRVEELFSLGVSADEQGAEVASTMLSAQNVSVGQAVRVARVGEKFVSVASPAMPYYLPEADGVVSRAGKKDIVNLRLWEEADAKRLVIAGCDPAIGLLGGVLARESGVNLVAAPASSQLALSWLVEGKVHVAGSHLEDAASGEFNLPYLKKQYPKHDFVVVSFAAWEEGWLTAKGNPKRVREVTDLARRGVRLQNREEGSGSRMLLERMLREAGVKTAAVAGFDSAAFGHLAAAQAVASGFADCCLATASAARTFGLDFTPLRRERFDFVLKREDAELAVVREFLGVLQRGRLRRMLEGVAGYDTAQTGSVLS
jgi:molybdate-binding protein/DNA-binding XRE family transcriptional regulator